MDGPTGVITSGRPFLGTLLAVLLIFGLFVIRPSDAGPWPPLTVHLTSQSEEKGDDSSLTFLFTLENLTDRPLEGLTIKAVPGKTTKEGARLVGSWAGSRGQNPGVFDGTSVGWIHDSVAPLSKEGPFAFTVNYPRWALATFSAYAWISWTGPAPGSFTSEELAVSPWAPPPAPRSVRLKGFRLGNGWNSPPQTEFTDIQGISYIVELDDVQPGDVIELRIHDQSSGQLVASSGNELMGAGAAWGGGGTRQLPAGAYIAEMRVNGTRQGESISFVVVPYSGPSSICTGAGAVDAEVRAELADEASRTALGAGAGAATRRGPGSEPGSARLQFAVAPRVGPEANPRDKAMQETERIMTAIKEGLAALGVPKGNLHSLQTAPDCRLVGPNPWGTPAPASPGA
ncbi:MAG: hypothetical protein Q8R28_01485 [Dehalococcoidia bacterium]|nr:hypothetical protein [Dehalococcoidia bacterium]